MLAIKSLIASRLSEESVSLLDAFNTNNNNQLQTVLNDSFSTPQQFQTLKETLNILNFRTSTDGFDKEYQNLCNIAIAHGQALTKKTGQNNFSTADLAFKERSPYDIPLEALTAKKSLIKTDFPNGYKAAGLFRLTA